MDGSLGRLVVALARRFPTVNGFMGVEPTIITSERFSAARNQPMRRTDPANGRTAAGVVQSEIGVTNRIRTGTNAVTGRDAACYIMITILKSKIGNAKCRVESRMSASFHSSPCILRSSLNWGPWSDSHRRLRVYETRPVASEAQGL